MGASLKIDRAGFVLVTTLTGIFGAGLAAVEALYLPGDVATILVPMTGAVTSALVAYLVSETPKNGEAVPPVTG